MVSGIVEEVFVREGMTIAVGAPVARLRDTESRAVRDALLAAIAAAERGAALAASRQDAADERLQRLRVASLRTELAVETERGQFLTLRAPMAGTVLTARPEERLGAGLLAGDAIISIGQTDSLDLDFGVDQREIDRVIPGAEVRLRVDALPSRTFLGEVWRVGQMAPPDSAEPHFPVIARIPNPDGLLKAGMVPHVRVLTEPMSVLGRVVRTPVQRLRLFWWRIWSWS